VNATCNSAALGWATLASGNLIAGGLPEWLTWFFQFKSYALLFVAAAVAAALGTPLYILVAGRLGWVDRPSHRKQHDRATATMGGLIVFAVVFAGAFVALNLNNLVGEMLRAHRVYVYAMLACTSCMILLGIVDDRVGLSPKIKLLVQLVVAVAAVALGFRVQAVTLPMLDSVGLPPIVGAAVSLLWIVGVTNAINLTDGLDGLAAGISFLAAAVNAFVAIWLGNHYMAVMMILLAGSLAGFLRWNFHPARVFLGDTGSLALGMYLSLASLHSAQKAHTVVMILVPLFALGYPIFDTLLAIGRRTLRGQPLMAGDRDHIHHRLLRRGGKPSWVAVQIYALSIVLCILCLAAVTSHHFVLGVGVCGAVLMGLFGARVLGYLEWGGWATKWTGRHETRVLHAAAHLARLKIERAETMREIAQAIGVLGSEIGACELAMQIGDASAKWIDESNGKPSSVQAAELKIGDLMTMRVVMLDGKTLDEERSQLLDEVARLAGDRASLQSGQTSPEAWMRADA
jgi:UDP-GlcNAc:undecaprenyl-phosphate GlcNAc-1-phosphate transferase